MLERIDYSSATVQELDFQGHTISIHVAPEGARLVLPDEVGDHYKGPREFEAIVDFGNLPEELGMRGKGVPKEEQWSPKNLPPKGITILEFLYPEIALATKEISGIAEEHFYADEEKCKQYRGGNRVVFQAGQRYAQQNFPGWGFTPSSDAVFIGLIRAGLAAGEMLGFPWDEQVLVQTKRPPLNGGREGNIMIGISQFANREALRWRLDYGHLVIGDPAGATFCSAVANIMYYLHLGIRPRRVDILNTVSSHKGSLFAKSILENKLGIETQIIGGGYSPKMNNNYYLETIDGKPSVRDAGDGLNRFLPSQFQL